MKGHPKANKRRDIPGHRVAAFIDHYVQTNYQLDEYEPTGTYQFAFESGLNPRTIFRIRSGESVNVKFTLLDGMLSKLDREYLWHWAPEDGGFSDYYQDEVPPAAKPTPEQERWHAVFNAKRYARKHGLDWQDVLREREAA